MVICDVVRRGIADVRRSGALAFWLVCLLGVAAAVVAHVSHAAGLRLFADDRWNADLDRSVIELLGYGFLVLTIGLLLRLFVVRAGDVYAAWAGALTLLLLDDALTLHERTGTWVERNLDVVDPPGLRNMDVGELGFWVVTGAVVSIGLLLAHRRSSAEARAHSLGLVVLVVLLMVFAVGLDMLHIAVKSIVVHRPLDVSLIGIEAAGEAAAMAAMAAYALHLVRQPRDEQRASRSTRPSRAVVSPLLRAGVTATSERLDASGADVGRRTRLPAG